MDTKQVSYLCHGRGPIEFELDAQSSEESFNKDELSKLSVWRFDGGFVNLTDPIAICQPIEDGVWYSRPSLV